MTARMRAPGLTRGFVFLVLGVLFSAALILVSCAAYCSPNFDGGMTTAMAPEEAISPTEKRSL